MFFDPTVRPPIMRLGGLLLVTVLLTACGNGADAPGDRALPQQSVTHLTDHTELFLEFAPLVAGERTALVAHLTWLDGYRPVTEGRLDVVLSGGSAPVERFRIETRRRPGIFRPTILPREAGERHLKLELTAPGLAITHELGMVMVHPSRQAAASARMPRSREGEIGFFKEQQWDSDFMIEVIQPGSMASSISAPATIRAAANGEFIIAASVPGLVRSTGRFPSLGDEVEVGQILAMLVPRTGMDADSASLDAERVAAAAAVGLAEQELARMERLHNEQAVSLRRLEEARAELEVARSQLRSVEQRLAQLGSAGQGGIELRAPIAGILARVSAARGAAVEAGDLMFHIVDRSELWLDAQVAEADVARLDSPTGVAFELPGVDEPFDFRIGQGARLVGVGQLIDPVSRSLPVIIALENADPRLRINQRLQARIQTGQARPALSVPITAVLRDAGQDVVYVMVSGESFSRRPVRLGHRDGDRIEVLEGLAEGEWVVGRGAMLVRLAAATPETMGHGHAH
ncbi:MAG: efflux RND transporter periplasmic adaptor subunit [Wenzhouxiangella sp.]